MQLDYIDSDFAVDGSPNICTKVEDPCDYYAGPVTVDACRCPHLDEIFPTVLDSGGFGILSMNESQSHPTEVDPASLKRHSINDLHFASLYSRTDACTTNIRGDSSGVTMEQTANASESILNGALNEGSRKPDRVNAKRSQQTHDTLMNQNVLKEYPFGEEEYKTDSLSSDGFSKHYHPILPAHLMEHAKRQRTLEKATWELNTSNLKEMKRIRPHERISSLGPKKVPTSKSNFDHRASKEESGEQKLKSCPSLLSISTKDDLNNTNMMTNKVEEWLEVIRQTRVNHWKYKRQSKRNRPYDQPNDWNGIRTQSNHVDSNGSSYCVRCPNSSKQKESKIHRGDELMRCLECSIVACGPVSLSCNQKSKQHMLQHFLTSGHSFGITCGTLGALFCMKCGDFVYSEPVEAEKERVDIRAKVGWLGWERMGFVNRNFGFRTGLNDFLVIPDDDFPGQDCVKKDIMMRENGDVTISDKKKLASRSKYHGSIVVWKGFRATYPHNVRDELVRAARRTYHRLKIFHGQLYDETSLAWSSKALQLFLLQNEKGEDYWKIQKPVGFYNMGNICFMSSVLQCIMNLRPLQRFFLCEAKHDSEACRELRKTIQCQPVPKKCAKVSDTPLKHKDATILSSVDNNDADICLACEMDKLFLGYYSSTIGMDVSEAIDGPPDPSSDSSFSHNNNIDDGSKARIGQSSTPIDQSKVPTKLSNDEKGSLSSGTPLIASDLLVSAWKCKEMAHLAGYEQRDAHEFLQALLDMIGKHCNRYHNISKKMRQESIPSIYARRLSTFEEDDDSKSDIEDIVQHSFGGSLRSVLICEICGYKRAQPEPFLNISLPVAKELVSMNETGNINSKGVTTTTHSVSTRRNIASKTKINLQACLNQFTSPEPLGDPVHCPMCQVKTSTLKQLTFAKLPKILCLHLKRFDALTNKKITNPVSFPIELDMGPHLPHWREVEQQKGRRKSSEPLMSSNLINDKMKNESCPAMLYDLCGTIDHTGTLNQGHYVSNVKVDDLWYHCNDAFVGRCGKGTGEEEVLSGDSAYMMFYVQKE